MECPKVNNSNLNSHIMNGILPFIHINIWNLKFTKNYKKEYHNTNCVFFILFRSFFQDFLKYQNFLTYIKIMKLKILKYFLCVKLICFFFFSYQLYISNIIILTNETSFIFSFL